MHSFVRSVCVRGADVREISKYTTKELEKRVDLAFARLLIATAESFFERIDGFINFGRMPCIALDPKEQKYRAGGTFEVHVIIYLMYIQ